MSNSNNFFRVKELRDCPYTGSTVYTFREDIRNWIKENLPDRLYIQQPTNIKENAKIIFNDEEAFTLYCLTFE